MRWVRHAYRGGEPRAAAALRLFRPRGLFQPSGYTKFDRYPSVFAFARYLLGDDAKLRLLSFGCSTGEEVFSLRSYFPEAAITGIDISADRIAACRRNLGARGGDARISFVRAADARQEASEAFDAVFAMAVFRHEALGARPESCASAIRFRDYEDAAAEIARCTRPGGLLAIRHANFRFSDTRAAREFEIVLSLPASADTPRYDRNDRLLPNEADEPVVFRKRV